LKATEDKLYFQQIDQKSEFEDLNNSPIYTMHKPSKSFVIENKLPQSLVKDSTKNSELLEKLQNIKNAIQELSGKMNDEVDTLNGVSNEHDKEIQNVFGVVKRIETQIIILKNEASHSNMMHEEHDLQIQELGKETQDNHRSMLLLKSMIRNQAGMLRSSVGIEKLDTDRGNLVRYHNIDSLNYK
jgi:hypothetical protein